MITLLLAATVAGLVTGRLVRRTITTLKVRRAAALPAAEQVGEAGERARVASEDALVRSLQTALPCKLGDVVLLASGEEAWLAGALLFRERAAHRDEGGDATRTVAALFIAPDGPRERAVYVRAFPEVSVDWMSPLTTSALGVGAEPPSALEHDGERFERARRVPLAVERVGVGAPDLGANAVLGEYDGGGGARLVVVVAGGATHAWRGRRLEPGMFEILPGKPDAS